jgi:hypothetical protein
VSFAKDWDANFTAEAFADASVDSLSATLWQVGTSPQRFWRVYIEATSWRPGCGTDGLLRFADSVEVELFPGMPLIVGVDDVVVGRATVRKVLNERHRKRLHPGVVDLEWWIMDCGLPDLIWARLRSWADGSADILTSGGAVERFSTKDDAVSWLCEDEYCELEVFDQRMFDVGLNLPLIWHPKGESDDEFAPFMLQNWRADNRTWIPTRRAR